MHETSWCPVRIGTATSDTMFRVAGPPVFPSTFVPTFVRVQDKRRPIVMSTLKNAGALYMREREYKKIPIQT